MAKNSRTYKCMVNIRCYDISCNYVACDKYDLNKHMTTIHKKPQPYTCYSCDLEFYRKRDIVKHLTDAVPCEWVKCNCADSLKQ